MTSTERATYEPLPNSPYVTFTLDGTTTSYDTNDDWKLVLRSATITDAVTRKFEVSVPGRDGALDLSESLGGVYYDDRKITMDFACVNYTQERFFLLASTIRNAIDGRTCRITFSSDLGYFWVGRPDVEVAWGGLNYSTVKIVVVVRPYKYSATSSYEAWKWDSFSFVDGVITQQSDISLNGETKSITLPRDPARGKPTLWLNSGTVKARMATESAWHQLKSGSNVFPEIRMSADASSTLYLNGTGSVGVEYRVGSL